MVSKRFLDNALRSIGAIRIQKWFRTRAIVCNRVGIVLSSVEFLSNDWFIPQILIPRSVFNPRTTEVSGDALGGVLGTNFGEFLIDDDLGSWSILVTRFVG